jgi:hypothetical protein
MSELSERADNLAAENSPGVVLENLFLGFFAAIGWVLGRSWFHGAKLLFLVYLAFTDGYNRGVKRQPKPAEPVTPPNPQPPLSELLADSNILDAYQTPFGVPFGPNVQAYSEPG